MNYLEKLERSDFSMLRPYQVKAKRDIFHAWHDGKHVVMLVMPTGMGKTFTFVDVIKTMGVPAAAIAHRQELVGQMSRSLAAYGIKHRIIAPEKVIRKIIGTHIAKFGKSFYDPNGAVSAVSVQTIMSWNGTGVDGDRYAQPLADGTFQVWERDSGRWSKSYIAQTRDQDMLTGKREPKNQRSELERYSKQVQLWVGDEGHHYLKDNMWGKAVGLFTRAVGLLVTATPKRADRKGLGSASHGLADVMIKTKSMRWAIDNDYLCDYRIVAPPTTIDVSNVGVSKTTGDYIPGQLADATENSSLVLPDGGVMGDVVKHYLKFGKGMLTVLFAPSVHICELLCDQFNAQGVKAAVLTGESDDTERFKVLAQFERREIHVLLNVGLFDEGFDCPAIECVQMVAKTESIIKYLQMIGRGLRTSDDKEKLLILDHVGNVERHGVPDTHREWTLDPGENASGDSKGGELLRMCLADDCYEPYPAYLKECPHCGSPPLRICSECKNLTVKEDPVCSHCDHVIEGRKVEFVDGDLVELDAEQLEALRGQVAEMDKPLDELVNEYRQQLIDKHTPSLYIGKHVKNFSAKQVATRESLEALREQMAWYGGYLRHDGYTDSEIHRRFYLEVGVDWLSAQVGSFEEIATRTLTVMEKIDTLVKHG